MPAAIRALAPLLKPTLKIRLYRLFVAALLPLNVLETASLMACYRPTFQISDTAPLALDCQLRRHRRVRCIWFVGQFVHAPLGGCLRK